MEMAKTENLTEKVQKMNKNKLTFWQNIKGYVYNLLLFLPILYIYGFILLFMVEGDLVAPGPPMFLIYVAEGFFADKSFAVWMFLHNFVMIFLFFVANFMLLRGKSSVYNFYKACFLFRNTVIPILILAFFMEKGHGTLEENLSNTEIIPLSTQWDSVFEWVMILLYLGLFTAVCIFAHKYGKEYRKCMIVENSDKDIPSEFLKLKPLRFGK
jgi:hypothetical protein